jgi:hypothetical protein
VTIGAGAGEYAGSLHAGQISRWACDWLTVQIEAVDDWIVIDGDQRIALAHDEFLNGKYTRTKFLCPACNRGCRMLHARDRTWTCRTCGGFDYQCRHRNRWARGLERLQSLRRRIALGYLLHGKKRKLRKAMLACEGEVIDSVQGSLPN